MSCRDLSYTGLREWEGDISTTLPSLEYLDVTGNRFYFPGSNLFSVNTLEQITGVMWSAACGECVLINTEVLLSLNDSDSFCVVEPEGYKFAEEIGYGKSFYFAKQGFSPQCLCELPDCGFDEIGEPYNVELNTLPRKLFYLEYVFGVIAVALNLVVVFISFGSSSLRKSTSFILIGNIGFCDIMIGVYSILIGRFTVYEFIVNEIEYPDMDVFVNAYCTIMGVIFTTSQLTSVTTSFLATIERYLAIVHCMNPEARLRKPVALWCLAGIWCVAIGYSLLTVFQVGGLRYHGEFSCMMPFLNGPEIRDISIVGLAASSLLVVLYLISFALYFHIFIHVKKSEVSAGVKRKASLAKNISLMVFTNFFFFVIPMACTLLFVYHYYELGQAFKVDTLKKLQIYFIMLSWLPVVFLSFNSCLNPFLCAFRHPKFQGELKARIHRCKCSCLRQSQETFTQAWTLTATKRLDLTSTETIVQSEIVSERYRSLDTL